MTELKESIWTCLENKDMNALKELLNKSSQVDILGAIQELPANEQVIVYRLLTKDNALFVFEQLDTSAQQQLLKSFTQEKVAELMNELDPDDRVKLLEELPAIVAKKLIASLSSDERKATNLLMGYEPETAGRVMTPEYVALKKDMTVDASFKKIKENAEKAETIYTLYVTNSTRKLEGVLSLKDLVLANPKDKIADIMQTDVVSVTTDTDQEEVAIMLQKFDLLAVPVVDKENRLVGILTVDDAMDILQEEITDDILDSAGISDVHTKETSRSEALIFGSIWQIWRLRLPFLIFTLIGGLLAALVIDGFEDTLMSVVVLAGFIPIIMDMGGNVGTQSATVFTRGLLLGHINMKRIGKNMIKEFLVGASMGILIGIVTGAIAAVWHGMPELGIVVGLSLIFVSTLAAILGFVVPYVLVKLNVDQASGTGPIITSIKDITGLLVYFYLATLFFGEIMYEAAEEISYYCSYAL
ncbi:MAG: magnesium transporter [Oscillospiraceae bacterium]|nr:magnesium transporter [Oscillospiraceae bacterium]